MFKSLRFFLLVLPVSLQAQFTYVVDQTIPVKDMQGDLLAMPWAGGLNAAHYNSMDLNGDAKDDLVLFDRTADKILTFINQDDEYKYAPEYENFFPNEITNWLLLRDFNCDGKKDIFTGDILGIKVYTNTTTPGANLEWDKFLFYSGFPGSKSPVLLTKGFSGKINLQLQFDDLPSITDVDGDGDLDIFNVHFVGEGTVEYHKNFSKERYGTCDSLDFERITQKWGDLVECDCGVFAFNNEECAPIGGRTKHAVGKSVLMLDIDGNSSADMLFSEADCTNLYALKNEGTIDAPVINSSSTFPSVSPVNFLIFPAAFYEDVDFDGQKDLISIPNIFSKTQDILGADLSHSNWLYKNTGTNTSPSFSYATNSFLQDQMIDVGDNAVPAFIDYDADGDYDMFISQNNSENLVARIKLYKNTGTVSHPEFTFEMDDVLGFSKLSFYNLKMQFADINHDAKIDLVFTATNFQDGVTRLYFLPNQSNTVLDFSEQAIQETGFTIFAAENILVVDVNNDGFQDLLVGKNSGALEYWRNAGQAGPVTFSREDPTYLNLNSSVLRQNISGTVSDLDADGKADLALGDQNGILSIISNFREATDATGASTNIIFNSLATDYMSKNLGGRIWPVAANIFNTNKPAIILGNVLGGINVLINDDGESLPKNPVISIFPNPSPKEGTINIKIDRPAILQIFTSLGQEIAPRVAIPANENYSIVIPYRSAGMYILRFSIRDKSFAKRIVIY